MDADDRVLVGVIKRARDVQTARTHHWYRIPYAQMPRGIHAEVLALFHAGAVRWYAEIRGDELAYRRDLLPDEPDHPHADMIYYRVALASLYERTPPLPNRGRRFAFIYTTWDRFEAARTLPDLYADDTHYVNRVYYALGGRGRRQIDLRLVPPARPMLSSEWY